jgi:hypothetical protein
MYTQKASFLQVWVKKSDIPPAEPGLLKFKPQEEIINLQFSMLQTKEQQMSEMLFVLHTFLATL